MPSAIGFLNYGLAAMPYVVAAALGVLLPALGALCYARFGVGLALIGSMFAIEALFMDVGGLQLGIALYYTDFALLFVGVVAGLRLLLARDVPRRHWGWIVFGVVFFVSLAWGLASFGTGAGVQARPYFYFLVTASYGLTFDIDMKRLRLAINGLVLIALLLLCITAYRWIVYYTPIRDLLPEGGAYNNDGPILVIRSHEALVLAEVLILGLFFPGAAGGLALARALAPLLLAWVLALQHRSAWVASFAGAMTSLWIGRAQSGKSAEQLVILVAMVTVTALPLALDDRLSTVGQQVGASASSALGGRGTAGERVESWRELIDKWAAAGPRSILIGQSFGSDPSRYVHDQERGGLRKITYTAHNFYVQTLFNMGLVGLLAFLATALYVVRGLYRACAAGTQGPEAKALLVLIFMQLTYYIPYGTDYLQGLVFGIAVAYVAVNERQRAAEAAADTRPMRRFPPSSRWA